MYRTQIYLTSRQTETLAQLSHTLHQSKSELIRSAINEFLSHRIVNNKLKKLRAARGMWKHHKNVLDVKKLRAEFDRL
ncbi:MAG: ribbon-helix-helix domain-containing protein [Chthoniobacterales bacterium]|nr:ribbon-helix-helix domain-containing protein [Chthoniobacterales bacterium]